MLMWADIAKQAVPFPKQTVADHWLAIWAAYSGSIAFVDKAMLKYRQHSRNQTGILSGVTDKESYCCKTDTAAEGTFEYAERAHRCTAGFTGFCAGSH